MTQMQIVFAILAAAGILFASNRVRPDLVALLTVLALMLSNTLTPREALSGFGDPVVILVACLLVVSESLTRTGVAQRISRWLMKTAGESQTRLLFLLMLVAALLGSVMSSTAVVAILIPAVLTIGRKTGIPASRLLIPLSYAALISGMLTLIATTPNMVVSAELDRAGYESFDFFDFTPIGLAVLVVAIAYMMFRDRRLLPSATDAPDETPGQTMKSLFEEFGLLGKGARLRVLPQSPLVGRSLEDSEIESRFGLWVFLLEREDRFGRSTKASPSPDFVVRAGDVLVVPDRADAIGALVEEAKLERLETALHHRRRWVQDAGLATILLHPDSRLLGRSLKRSRFRSRFGLNVIALRRRGELLEDILDVRLANGDELLVLGPWDRIGRLQRYNHDFVVLALPAELREEAPARRLAPVALLIVVAMIVLAAMEIVPVVVAAMLASLAAVFTRTLTMSDAYRSIDWTTLVLIAGMLPAAVALDKTGGIDAIVEGLVGFVGTAGPYVMLTAIFFLTAGLGLFLSNTATAVLMAPIAIASAEAMGVSPFAFSMTVAIAASAAFITPFSTPVVTLVVTPGGYKFTDFVRAGTPLLILTWLVSLVVIPLVFRF